MGDVLGEGTGDRGWGDRGEEMGGRGDGDGGKPGAGEGPVEAGRGLGAVMCSPRLRSAHYTLHTHKLA